MRFPFLSLVLVGLSGCGVLHPQDAPVAEPVITSVAEADRIEAAAAANRARVEAQFADSEVLCYQKFFVNACLDDAREIRRAALAPFRAAEVASARFKREASVQQRDRELADAEVAYEAKLKQAQIDEAAKPPAAPAEPALADGVKEKKPGLTQEQRVARRDAREQQAAQRKKEQAAQRAENVAALEAKRQESKERVRRVEEKKAIKARGRETD